MPEKSANLTKATPKGKAIKHLQLPGRSTMANELYTTLRNAIIAGDLKPGERLVEETVAEWAKVSRTPVREALQRLEADGFAQSSKRGIVVAQYSNQDLADLCIVRENLEALACRLAATTRSEMHVATLNHLLQEMREATLADDLPSLTRLANSFHGTIWEASRNRYLAGQLGQLRSLIERMQMTTTLLLRERRSEALKDHAEMAEAIEQRDEARAGELAQSHFRASLTLRLAFERAASRRSGD